MSPAHPSYSHLGGTGDHGLSSGPMAGRSWSGRVMEQEHSTALKWSSNGELSVLDLHRIVERLADADPMARGLDVSHFRAVKNAQEF